MPELFKSRLKIHKLKVLVHLGCLPAERKTAQPVFFDIEIEFAEAPKACSSDELADSICYAQISDALTALAVNREFKLIEFLAREAYQVIRDQFLNPQQKLKVFVHKAFPPIEQENKGTSFSFGDFL